MCCRFVTNIPVEVLKGIFSLIEAPQLEPRFNLSAVVRNLGGSNRLDLLKWGLVPGWSKSLLRFWRKPCKQLHPLSDYSLTRKPLNPDYR